MKLLTVLLALMGAGLILLIVNHDSGRTLGIVNDDFGRLLTLGVIATMIGAGVVRSRHGFGERLRQFGIWVLVFLAMTAVYLYRADFQSFGNRLMAGLMPGRAAVFTDNEGHQEVILHKAMNGHFETDVTVNGESVRMLVDTGASTVALSYEDARTLGLDPKSLTYSARLMTANGEARGATVTLRDIAVGPITRNDIRAVVAEEGRLDQSLLGMSYLSTLDFLQMQTDELRLRD